MLAIIWDCYYNGIIKRFKGFFIFIGLVFIGAALWLGLLYRVYGMQTLLFLVQSPPEFILTYTKNILGSTVAITENKQEETEPIAIPAKHMITTMSHMYQKLNNCGPSSAAMAASTLGVNFDQFAAADVLKGTYTDKNVSPEEMVAFLETQGLKTVYRVNGKASQVEQLVASDIPVIVEQWLVKRGSGELVGHYRVVRGYDQAKQIFTTNDSFNGPNFVIPYKQFDEWWRPFNRGYLVVFRADQEEVVKKILGRDWTDTQNWMMALESATAETKSIGDGYSHFNVGTNAVLLDNYSLAVSAYDLALTKSLPKEFLWYQFGQLEAYYQTGQYDKVLELTGKLLASAGEVEEARYYRGLALAKQGKTEEAKGELEKALKANPRYKKASEALSEL